MAHAPPVGRLPALVNESAPVTAAAAPSEAHDAPSDTTTIKEPPAEATAVEAEPPVDATTNDEEAVEPKGETEVDEGPPPGLLLEARFQRTAYAADREQEAWLDIIVKVRWEL